jgi:aldose 1-epimerase
MNIETYQMKIPGVIEVKFLNYGGIVQEIIVPDKNKQMTNVVLGYTNPKDYLKDDSYLGALIGRYANRISFGHFKLEGKDYSLTKNHGPHTLHGGNVGFNKVIWNVRELIPQESYLLSYVSKDGEEGFPGNLEIEVTYTITKGREFIINYKATTDKATYLNLTNHTYFNLSGNMSSSILSHKVWINADYYTEVDKDLIPTGKFLRVEGRFDFRKLKEINEEYDHNFVLNEAPIRDPKARVIDPTSGRMLEVFTTRPGLQFYTGNFLKQKNTGLCLETQHYPDSPNHPDFPTTLLRPGEMFQEETILAFHDEAPLNSDSSINN